MIVRVLFDGLWEGAAIVAIAYLVNCCVPQRNATTRYAVWFATLLALVAVPVLTVLSNAGALLLTALQPHAAAGETCVEDFAASGAAAGAWRGGLLHSGAALDSGPLALGRRSMLRSARREPGSDRAHTEEGHTVTNGGRRSHLG